MISLRGGERLAVGCPAATLAALLSACAGEQSAFDTGGVEAERVLQLFWVMFAGATVIWVSVVAFGYYVTRARPGRHGERIGVRLIIWGGCVFPTVVLAGLLFWGLGMMPELRRPADGPTIAVSGERFWWRVAYDVEGGPGVVRNLPPGGIPSANEIWLPAGGRSEILLSSPDVIHSFWVPSLAGKMDAIPGRVTRLVLEPTETGVYNGACAEFCGTAHAMMGFRVVVVPEAEYATYVQAQAAPAAVTQGPGPDLFIRNGCAACHTVRGTPADGDVEPDLTHVARRITIAGGLLPTTVENIAAPSASGASRSAASSSPARSSSARRRPAAGSCMSRSPRASTSTTRRSSAARPATSRRAARPATARPACRNPRWWSR